MCGYREFVLLVIACRISCTTTRASPTVVNCSLAEFHHEGADSGHHQSAVPVLLVHYIHRLLLYAHCLSNTLCSASPFSYLVL